MNKDNLQELVNLNIIPASGVVFDAFKELYSDALYCDYASPSSYVKSLWEKYKTKDKSNSKNGKVFESIFATILYREGIYPIYVQAKIAFLPNVNFDFVVYSKEHGPVSLSLKMSLRERYKQADLEAIALKYVHRKSKSFLVTLNKIETENVNKKIKSGDIIGIDEVCFAEGESFDRIIKELKELSLHAPGEIKVITAYKIIKGS
jgi:hypothetical protein